MELTPRIKRRISRDYAPEDRQGVEELLLDVAAGLREDGITGTERIVAAVLIHSSGDVDRLLIWAQDALIDFRDPLMGTGLEHGDWPDRLDIEFGTDS